MKDSKFLTIIFLVQYTEYEQNYSVSEYKIITDQNTGYLIKIFIFSKNNF